MTIRVAHLWSSYYPNLFDRSHNLCIRHGVPSELVCRWVYDKAERDAPSTAYVRRISESFAQTFSLAGGLRRRAAAFLDDRRFGRLVTQRMAEFEPSVLHIHYGLTGAILVAGKSFPEKPFIVSFYGVDASASLRDARTVRLYREMFERGGIVHVLCKDVADRMMDLGCSPERIRIVNLPASIELFPDVGTTPAGATRFLIPARFIEKKGHRVLLRAFARLRSTGSRATLTCWGYGDPNPIRAMISDLKLQDVVQVIDNRLKGSFVESFSDILRTHDVIVAPSISAANGDDEGGPALTVVTAQAASKPVIVSDFPGAERSVSDGIEGLVVPQRDVDALFEAMRRVDGAVEVWRSFGAAGRRRVLAEFSEEAYWRELSKIYEELQIER